MTIHTYSSRLCPCCSVATGLYGFPSQLAAQIAVDACAGHTLDKLVFDVFSDRDLEVYRHLLG